MHAHHGEDTTDIEQLFGAPQADRAVTLDAQPIEFVVSRESRAKLTVPLQDLAIDVTDELQEGSVLRHFGSVHFRHGAGKQSADFVGIRMQRCHQYLHCHRTRLRRPAWSDGTAMRFSYDRRN